MLTRIKYVLDKKKWEPQLAIQVFARGKWCWVTNGFKICRYKTHQAVERERAKLRKRKDDPIL